MQIYVSFTVFCCTSENNNGDEIEAHCIIVLYFCILTIGFSFS